MRATMTAQTQISPKLNVMNSVTRLGILLAALLAAGAICASAQQPNTAQIAAQPAQAQPAAAQPASAARRQQLQKKAKEKPSPAQPAPDLTPPAPPPPNWPANDQPSPASVVWNSQGLRIDASNSSLQQILKEVSTDTGAKVEGMHTDQRVFGTFGPGPAREVLSQLLDGTGLNVLMIGDQGQGTPREIVLSEPPKGPAPAVPPNQAQEEENDIADQPPPPQPQPPPQQPPNIRNGFNPGGQPRTPQQIIQELQQRQQQIQQMQQQQQQQQQQNSPP